MYFYVDEMALKTIVRYIIIKYEIVGFNQANTNINYNPVKNALM